MGKGKEGLSLIETNEQAVGYMILALKALGWRYEDIKAVESEMKYQMDTKTESDAEKAYNGFI